MAKITFQKDFREFLSLLAAQRVKFLVVGGYAVGLHGYPRFTGDLDVFVDISPANAARLVQVFRSFGFDVPDLTEAPFLEPNRIVEIGHEPTKIQVMTSISGVTFEEAWSSRTEMELSDLQVPFIGYAELIRNKLASGRAKDAVDAETLERRRCKQ